MYGENKFEMQCAEFDLVMADAIDGLLTGEQLAKFESHKASCPACAAMFADTAAGASWLQDLGEIEPPRNLVHNIVAATSGVAVAAAEAKAEEASHRPLWERLKNAVRPVLSPVFTPRFAMSAAMAFFSVSTVLTVGDIKVSDFRKMDLTPKGIARTYYATEAKAVKYYENIRLVYEIESRVRELRRAATTDSNEEQKDEKPNNKGKESTGEPDKEYRNYSQGMNDLVLASVNKDAVLGIPARQRRIV